MSAGGSGFDVNAVLNELNELAKHGFEFYLGGVGVVAVLFGLIVPPFGPIGDVELLLVAGFGFAALLTSVGVWVHKSNLIAKTNYEKLANDRFADLQNSIRYRIAAESREREKLDKIK